MILLYLRADFLVRVKQHSELWCNRRQAESNVKLEYCRGAEEEGEANRLLTTVKSRRARGEPSLLELSRVRRRKTKSKLTKKDAGERVKDHSFCFWAKCSTNKRVKFKFI